MESRFPLYQIEQINLGFDAMLGDAHKERAEKVLGSHTGRSQERSGNPADGQIRTQYHIPAESEARSTHEVQHGGPSRNFIRFGQSGHT